MVFGMWRGRMMKESSEQKVLWLMTQKKSDLRKNGKRLWKRNVGKGLKKVMLKISLYTGLAAKPANPRLQTNKQGFRKQEDEDICQHSWNKWMVMINCQLR